MAETTTTTRLDEYGNSIEETKRPDGAILRRITQPDGNILIEFRCISSGATDAWLKEKIEQGYTTRTNTKLGDDGLYGATIKEKEDDE